MSNVLEVFLSLCERALDPSRIKELIVVSDKDEEIAFHKVYDRLLDLAASERERALMETRYPFVKVSNRWRLSVPAMWMYLQASRAAMARTKNPVMMKVYDAITLQQHYVKEAREAWESLRPANFENLEDYHKKLAEKHDEMCTRQLELFREARGHAATSN